MKYIRKLILGTPLRGEPVDYKKVSTKVVMPPGINITYEEWEAGSWINNIN